MEKIRLGKVEIHFDDLNFEVALRFIKTNTVVRIPYSDWERIHKQSEIIAKVTNGELDGHYALKKEND